jgi:hypothetical protein
MPAQQRKIKHCVSHGSTRKIAENVLIDTNEAYMLDMINEANADGLCVGHAHKPYHRFSETATGYKHLINIGPVGTPKDNNAAGCYVRIILNVKSTLSEKDGSKVGLIRVNYGVEKAAKAVEESTLPNELTKCSAGVINAFLKSHPTVICSLS